MPARAGAPEHEDGLLNRVWILLLAGTVLLFVDLYRPRPHRGGEEPAPAPAPLSESAPTDAAGLVERAHERIERGEYVEALSDLQRALELRPGFPPARHHRGQVLLRLDHFDQALADFDYCIDAEPENAPPYFDRALAHAALLRFIEARSDLHAFLARSDDEDRKRQARELLSKWKAES